VQYVAKSMQDLEIYREDYSPALQEDHTKRYQGKFDAFRTVLEIVHEFRL
jgi:hypothetical protein